MTETGVILEGVNTQELVRSCNMPNKNKWENTKKIITKIVLPIILGLGISIAIGVTGSVFVCYGMPKEAWYSKFMYSLAIASSGLMLGCGTSGALLSTTHKSDS